MKNVVKLFLAFSMALGLVGCDNSNNKQETNQELEYITDYATLVSNIKSDLVYTYEQIQDGYDIFYLGYYDGKVYFDEMSKATLDSFATTQYIKAVNVSTEEEEVILDCRNQQYKVQWMANESSYYYFDIYDMKNAKFIIMKYDGKNLNVVDEGIQKGDLSSIKLFYTDDRIWYLRYQEGCSAELCYIKDGELTKYKTINYKDSGDGYYLNSNSDHKYFYTITDKNHVFYTDGIKDYDLDFDFNVYNTRILNGYLVVNEAYKDTDNAYNYRIHIMYLGTLDEVERYGFGVSDTMEIIDGIYLWSTQTSYSDGAAIMASYINNDELVRSEITFDTKGDLYTLHQNNIVEQEVFNDIGSITVNIYEMSID